MSLSVGDRVRIKEGSWPLSNNGHESHIVEAAPPFWARPGKPVWIIEDRDGYRIEYMEDELELIE